MIGFLMVSVTCLSFLCGRVESGKVVLKWGSSYYDTVLRTTVSGGYYGIIAEHLNNPEYTDDSVQSGETYYYVVQAGTTRSEEISIEVPK